MAAHTESRALPENMFAAFTLPSKGPTGTPVRVADPLVHYGNVDTGSMVNVMYSGVLTANPALLEYKQEFTHVICGVGDKITRVICKLVDVPLSLGKKQASGSLVTATFYVIECPQYHFILGLTLLGAVNGIVDCGKRQLLYTAGPKGGGEERKLQLLDRREVQSKPAYRAVHTHVDTVEVGPATWHEGILPQSALAYVEESLVDILAFGTLEHDRTQYAGSFPAAVDQPVVDFSTASTPETPFTFSEVSPVWADQAIFLAKPPRFEETLTVDLA